MPSAFYWQLMVPAALRTLAPFNLFVERQLSSRLKGNIGSGRDSRSRLAALPRRCELEVSVRPSAAAGSMLLKGDIGRGFEVC